MIGNWTHLAACTEDPDLLFVRGAQQHVAKRICKGCRVRYLCLADALDNRIEYGVWGGMTERERRALLRKNPQVTNWGEWLRAAAGERAVPPSGQR